MFQNLTKQQKRQYILIGIAVLLFITNPSVSDFREYKGMSGSYSRRSYSYISRKFNFLLFSLYHYSGDYYIGIADNFIDITYHPKIFSFDIAARKSQSSMATTTTDTVAYTDYYDKDPLNLNAGTGLDAGRNEHIFYWPYEFAALIKQKYPQYKDVEDGELNNGVFAKFPVYRKWIYKR